jgi:hypothetical protein
VLIGDSWIAGPISLKADRVGTVITVCNTEYDPSEVTEVETGGTVEFLSTCP